MRIEVGRTYRDRAGREVPIVRRIESIEEATCDGQYTPMVATNGWRYAENGYYDSLESEFDLVELAA